MGYTLLDYLIIYKVLGRLFDVRGSIRALAGGFQPKCSRTEEVSF